MSQVQKAFNSQARESTAGTRKKGKLERKRGGGKLKSEQPDTNVEIIVPKTQEEKDNDRRERLRQELATLSESKWNAKKKKRMEKYIDKKLKKEERVRIFEKLVQTQAEIPSSLNLQSSSTLGTGKVMTHQERLDRLEDKEVRRAFDGRTGKRRRPQDIFSVEGPDGEGSEDDEMLSGNARGDEPDSEAKMDSVAIFESMSMSVDLPISASAAQQVTTISPMAVGSALQRNPDGTIVAPTVRKKTKETCQFIFSGWKTKSQNAASIKGEDSDSFDSSDSAYDSPDGSEDGNSDFSDGEGSGDNQKLERSSVENNCDEEECDDEDSEEKADGPIKPKKSLGFKEWAMKQLDVAKGYGPSVERIPTPPLPSSPPKKKRKVDDFSRPSEMRGPLGETLQLPSTAFAQSLQDTNQPFSAPRKKVVEVKRPADVEEARMLLPITSEEQPIMEAILLNPVVIICGETGSGKTTQVPQFLYEAGFGHPDSDNPGMIGITQPRRVAAMSMAARVAHELSLTSSKVSYQIRYDATVSPATSIKFMTDGVLLRELATDFLLTKYSVILIDEAHERSMNTDVLIGVLSRIIKLRETMWKEGKHGAKPLRLIIMSATLRVSDFAENNTLFSSPPPVINVAARQHPVTVHFNRRTSPDYITEAIKKTVKIHTRLPPGGILVFLTGQNEITGVCRKLESRFGKKASEEKRRNRLLLTNPVTVFEDHSKNRNVVPVQADVEAEDMDLGPTKGDDNLAFDVDGDGDGYDSEALDSADEEGLNRELNIDEETDVPMHVIPLYSLLPSEKQMRVFQPPPPGSRLIIVSTNVAETSLTIPGIRYVVDCGRAKERRYDINNGIQAFQVNWISKASAAQRAGRAGRTGPGHCYRLYSSALYENYFDEFSHPEILSMPVEGVVLQMKSMHIDAVINFPFPTPPERSALQKAENTLTHLGALRPAHVASLKGLGPAGNQITDLGKAMALFPLSPRFSRMLVSGQQHGCLPYVISIVSALSVGDPFIFEETIQADEEEQSDDELAHLTSDAVKAREALRRRRKAFHESQHTHASLSQFTSDILKVLSVVGAYEYAGGGSEFCSQHFVRPKAMEEIHKLRAQISNIVQANFSSADPNFVPDLGPPTNHQIKVLRQLIAAAFIDQVAVRKDRVDRQSGGVQYATCKGVPYRALGVDEDVYIHPSSVLMDGRPPEYVVFHEVVRTSKIWLKGVTVVNPAWLSSLGKLTLCTFSKPIKSDVGIMMTIPRFGPEGWELPAIRLN